MLKKGCVPFLAYFLHSLTAFLCSAALTKYMKKCFLSDLQLSGILYSYSPG
jgi:hypothetical protein